MFPMQCVLYIPSDPLHPHPSGVLVLAGGLQSAVGQQNKITMQIHFNVCIFLRSSDILFIYLSFVLFTLIYLHFASS